LNQSPEAERTATRLEAAPGSATAKESVATTAAPVKLQELAAPAVLDMAGGADANAGVIDVTSSPPANVVLDGRPLGQAPRVVKAPPGIHTVLFIHPLYGRQSLSVNVTAGRTSRAAAEF